MRNNRLLIALLMALAVPCMAQEFGKYIWEFPEAADIRLPAEKAWMLDELRTEVDKILAAGHLAPYYFNAGDLHHEGYFLYVAPGRIITTLAWAYPHLSADQQKKARAYVADELANPKYAPWSGSKLPWSEGAGREGLGKPRGFNFDRWWGMEGQHRPFLHTLYGLWLWGWRSGEWDAIQRHWPAIVRFYNEHAGKAEIYGELGTHIAMARLAQQFKDDATRKTAIESAEQHFRAGLDYPAIEKASLKYFNRLKETHHNVLGRTHFMMLNLVPETGRYLHDHVRDPVLAKHDTIVQRSPKWWLIAPGYASWAGNIGPDCEAQGLPREIFGMVYPIQRWVAQSNPDTLASFMASGPDGLGDCYWLEPLTWTIEAHGQIAWRDVRNK